MEAVVFTTETQRHRESQNSNYLEANAKVKRASGLPSSIANGVDGVYLLFGIFSRYWFLLSGFSVSLW